MHITYKSTNEPRITSITFCCQPCFKALMDYDELLVRIDLGIPAITSHIDSKPFNFCPFCGTKITIACQDETQPTNQLQLCDSCKHSSNDIQSICFACVPRRPGTPVTTCQKYEPLATMCKTCGRNGMCQEKSNHFTSCIAYIKRQPDLCE